jgi:D-alanyl-D-alanine carboxypeptidase (penicillin-binding protein 5/6)
MTASANDASVVLAQEYAGSVAAWTYLMNDAAKRLGMKHSHFNTPNGWPDGGQTYVSAGDLVRLASAMVRNFPSYYGTYSGKKEMPWKESILRSRDPITGVIDGADGIKTGYTREAGYNFLGSAKQGVRRLVMVVGGAPTPAQRNAASIAYLQWGFSQFRARPLFGAGQTIVTANVQGGTSHQASLVARQPVYATVPQGSSESITLQARYSGPLQAPIRKDQQVGELEIRVGNMAPGRVPLYAAQAVGIGGPMDRIINGFMNLFI